jgi:hypothetical protein
MGVVKSIGATEFPKQGSLVATRLKVCFNYDTTVTVGGTVVRDDIEHPYVCIIKLDDGRYVLATECQYSCS